MLGWVDGFLVAWVVVLHCARKVGVEAGGVAARRIMALGKAGCGRTVGLALEGLGAVDQVVPGGSILYVVNCARRLPRLSVCPLVV